MAQTNLEEIVSLAKRRGFIYQGSEIYGGLAGTWDYGPLGAVLKRNIENCMARIILLIAGTICIRSILLF